MENERDVAFRSRGLGEIDQGVDFNTPSAGSIAGDGTDPTSESGSHGAAAKAKEMATTAGERAAEKVQDRLESQKHRAADSMQSVAQSLRAAGEQLPESNGMSRYMLKAANQVDNLAAFLDNRELSELVDEVEDFARRQPALFLGGAFAMGVLGARFIKSSRRNLDRTEWGPDYTSTSYTAPSRGDRARSFDTDSSTGGDRGIGSRDTMDLGYESGNFGTQQGTSSEGIAAASDRPGGTPGQGGFDSGRSAGTTGASGSAGSGGSTGSTGGAAQRDTGSSRPDETESSEGRTPDYL